MRRLLLLAFTLSPVTVAAQSAAAPSPYHVAAPAPRGYDRAAMHRRTETHLRNLIALRTENPPGREMLAARYFDSVFTAMPGVETRIVDAGDGRAHFIARLRAAQPTERPVLVMGHMDVVTADTARWSTPPFEPTVKDGYLYGRGVIDDKGMLAATASAMQALAAQRNTLSRDIIFLGTAAEEGGDVGVDWLVERHPELLRDAEFALNEGGRIRVADGKIRTVNIQTTEKVYYAVACTATGPSGHGSVPLPDNALAALARAVARIHAWRPAARRNETTRLYFERLATIEADPDMRRAMQLFASTEDEQQLQAAATVLSSDPLHNAVLRTGASLTILDGGIRENVIPSEGRAVFNVRVPPGVDIVEVVREMNEVAAERSVTCALEGEPRDSPPPSPTTSVLFQAMESAARTMAPEALVIPFMSTGATDGAVLRAEGIPTYGILPLPLPMEDELRMHGDDERAPLESLGWATEYVYRVLKAVAGGR